ncbi:MAG: hypothetical protein KA144_07805 [Xanthomonadaceae bacterium]|nr:hypothetical protein [Xanthomonadaceae bacterium]
MTQSLRRPQSFRPLLLGAVLSVCAFALAACRQEASPVAAVAAASASADADAKTQVAPTPAAVVEVDAAKAAPAFLSGLSQDMPYARLREAVIAAGWVPLRDPACWENVGGAAAVCGALPETESCSGDGACLLWFADPSDGRRLRVSAYGPYERWNVAGQESTFAVRSWDLRPAAPVAASACPNEDFDAFLKRFAADATVRRTFTAPVVEVGELYTDDQGNDASRTVYVPADAYRDFDMVYRDGAFHHEDAKGAVDSAALPVKIESPSANVRVVRFDYGMSEGNSYRFETRGGCWTLTGDPEPPSP